MKEFKIKPNGFQEIRKRLLIRAIPLLLLAVGVGITISTVNTKKEENNVNVLPLVIPMMAVAVGVGMYRGVRRQKSLFESYTLTLTNNVIMREQLNTPPVSLYFNDVREIVKAKNGGFVVRGKEPADVIIIPCQIDNNADLEVTLQSIRPISTKSTQPAIKRYSAVLPLLTLGLMVAVYTLTNKVVVATTGTLLISVMVWSFLESRRSRNIDHRTKRSMWWVLVVLASVVGAMIMKLTAPTP
jgi:hypothetical protein